MHGDVLAAALAAAVIVDAWIPVKPNRDALTLPLSRSPGHAYHFGLRDICYLFTMTCQYFMLLLGILP